ncbi:BGTF surface domain-containing protein [Haloarchaeobius sp. FL176]|uniref:DUF7827 domain-containing protein n=1 Tax=Haloarchaeobius sp. FL176 TaxID=2967129 RepID=UPI002147A6B7|nr:BGTF surface domain-containing protein [Haloarchaeobius sp. FL176]
MTDTTKQVWAIGLAALMVLSVFAAVPVSASATPSQAALTASGPDSPVDQGGQFQIEYTLTNDGDEDAGSAAIALDTPSGVEAASASGDGQLSNGVVIYLSGVDQGSSVTTTVTFNVASDASTGDLAVTADGAMGESESTVDTSVTVQSADDGQDGDDGDDGQDYTPEIDEGDRLWSGQVAYETDSFAAGENVELEQQVEDGWTFETAVNNDDGVVTVDTSGLSTDTYRLTNNDGSTTVEFDVTSQRFSVEDVSPVNVTNEAPDSTTEIELDSNRNGYTLYIVNDKLTPSETETVFGVSGDYIDWNEDGDSNDEADALLVTSTTYGIDSVLTADFDSVDDQDTGAYETNFVVADTGNAASATVNVDQAQSGSADFAASNSLYQDELGDLALVTVTMDNTKTAAVQIGNADEGYTANLTVTDENKDGSVAFIVNTASMTDDNAQNTFLAVGDDSVTPVDESYFGSNELIATGGYQLEIAAGSDTTADAQNVGTFDIRPRSTTSLNTWTIPGNANLDVNNDGDVDGEDVTAGINASVITESDDIASGDYLVHELEASGLSGFGNVLAVANSDSGLAGDVSLTVTEADPARNFAPRTVSLSSENTDVIAPFGADTYYLVSDTDDLTAERDGRTFDSLVGHGDYVANLTVAKGPLAGSQQTVTTEFQVIERSTSIDVNDEDMVVVESDSAQTISGESTLAPGTKINFRLPGTDADSGVSFLEQGSATVQPDGTWSFEANFSDVSVNSTFSVNARVAGSTVATADGMVTEAAAPASFEVSDLSAPGTVTVGDEVTATATVANNGGTEGTTTVEFTFGGDVVDSREVTLAPGESKTVEFSIAADVDAGTYTHGISAGDSSRTAEITVEAESTPTPTETATPTPTETATPTPTATQTDTPTDTESDDGGQPGFGIGVALVALMGAALLALRRQN